MADHSYLDVPEQILESLGRNIKTYREVLGWTPEQLADRAGLSRSHIWKIEQGRSNPRLLTLLRITDALGCDVSHVLTGDRGFKVYAARAQQRIDELRAQVSADDRRSAR